MRYALLLIVSLISFGAVASDLGNVVKTESGYVLGSGSAIRVYKGIPFAAPPVRDLRWQPPQPARSWTTIRTTKTFSLSCAQAPVAIPKDKSGEDCLTVNVWTPASREKEKLPVLVSIYGGGFVGGSSAPSLYDGERLASQGVVVVSFNYRIGIFGFLAHPELSKESPRGVSGNYALLDMIAALQWTQRNIAAFGGDASNVTIWGESAGATAVSLLMVIPQAQGLFQKAIANSSWSMYHPMSRLRESGPGRISAENLGARLGSLTALRAKSTDELIQLANGVGNASTTIDPDHRGESYRPNIDGVILPDDPALLLSSGKFHHVPFIAGTNADDGGLFTPRVTTLDQANAWLRDQFGSEAAMRLGSLYGLESNTSATIAKLTGDALFLMGTRSMLRAAAKYNPNVYQYEFTHINGLGKRMLLNAFHGSDLGYTFGTLPESLLTSFSPALTAQPGDYNEVDERLSQAMSGAIVQFARTGNPNGKLLPHWTPFGKDENYMEYGDTIAEKKRLRAQYLDALDDIYAAKRLREPALQ